MAKGFRESGKSAKTMLAGQTVALKKRRVPRGLHYQKGANAGKADPGGCRGENL